MSARRYAATTLEVVVALVLAFMVGRLTTANGAAAPSRVDVGFSQDMAVHHEQAIEMATLARTRGGPAVQALAGAIIENQSAEVGMLRGWLRLWHKPSVAKTPMSWMASARMPAMSMHGVAVAGMSSDAMPGMASPGELADLWALSGKAFDVLFLQLMIRHHEGGIEMDRYAAAKARTSAVRDAARAMSVAQIEDLAQMRPMLAADGAAQLPAP